MSPYINIHTHHPGTDTLSILNIRIQEPDPVVPPEGYFSAGIHPWDAGRAVEEWLDIFQTPDSHLIAIGETGLDYRPEYQPYQIQKEWFIRQIGIANRLRKPLIIHNVHAPDDIFETLTASAEVPVILHGFIGSHENIRQWRRHKKDTYFSFGPTTLRSAKTQEALQVLADQAPDHFFLETDDNQTTGIEEMYTFAAGLLRTGIGDLKNRIAQNFNTLFPDIITER